MAGSLNLTGHFFAAHIANTLVQARLRAGRLRHDFPSGNGVASGRDGLATLHRPAVGAVGLLSTAVLSASNLDGRELLVQHPRMASSLDLAGLLRAIADIAHGLFDTRLRAGRLRHNRPSGIGVAGRRDFPRLSETAILTLSRFRTRFCTGGFLDGHPLKRGMILFRTCRSRARLGRRLFCQRRDGKQHDQRHHGRKQQLPGLHRPYLQVLLCSTGIPARRSQFPAPPRGVII